MTMVFELVLIGACIAMLIGGALTRGGRRSPGKAAVIAVVGAVLIMACVVVVWAVVLLSGLEG